MSILLRLKHWQLFGLLIGIPFVIQIIGILSIVLAQNQIMMFAMFPLIIISFTGVFFGWFYAMAVYLNKKLPDTVRIKLTKFKLSLLFPIVYIVFFTIFMSGTFGNLIGGGDSNNTIQPGIFGIILPFHFFSMFCIFYCIYFCAKSIKTVELQRHVAFNDYAGEFFLICFFPIGVWFIQPRINKLFNAEN